MVKNETCMKLILQKGSSRWGEEGEKSNAWYRWAVRKAEWKRVGTVTRGEADDRRRDATILYTITLPFHRGLISPPLP